MIENHLRLLPNRQEVINIILEFEALGYNFDEIMEMIIGTALEIWGIDEFYIDRLQAYVQSVFNSYFSQ